METLGEPIWNPIKIQVFSTMKLLCPILMLKIMKIFNSKGDRKNYGNFKKRKMTSTMAILWGRVSQMIMNSNRNFDKPCFNVGIASFIPSYSFCYGICHVIRSCLNQMLVDNLLPTFVPSTHPIVLQVVAQVFVHLVQFMVSHL